jgi:hypothetical protein
MERKKEINESSEIKISKPLLFKLVKEYKELYKSIPKDDKDYDNQRIRAKIIYNILDNMYANNGVDDLFKKLEKRKKWVENIDKRYVALCKHIKEILDWHFLNTTGYRKINGGYADVRIDDLIEKDGYIKVVGYLAYGEDDMGDGGSVKYTSEIEIYLGKKTNPAETPIPEFEYYIVAGEEIERVKAIFDDE